LAREIVCDAENNEFAFQGFAVSDGYLGTDTLLCDGPSSGGFVDYWYAVFMAGHQIPWKDFEVVMRACHHKLAAMFAFLKA
jgi:hypothetical protein